MPTLTSIKHINHITLHQAIGDLTDAPVGIANGIAAEIA